MRFVVLAILFAVPGLAAEVEHSGTYVGWGGAGEQVFRHKISICRNHNYSDRSLLVIVDDLPRRGTRSGLFKFTVTYEGGTDASPNLLKTIHKKPYDYVMIPMYKVPQSARMARVVLPNAKGVKATFKFYHSVHRGPNGEKTDGYVAAHTRTFDAETLVQLPVIHPMRDPSIRRPRTGEDPGPAPTVITMSDEAPTSSEDAPAATPSAAPSAAPSPAARLQRVGASGTLRPVGLAGPRLAPTAAESAARLPEAGVVTAPAGDSAGFAPLPIDPEQASTFDPAPDDPRILRTRAWSQQVATEIREKAAQRAREGRASGASGLDYAEDTPEMIEARRRAEAMDASEILERSTALQ